MMVLDGDDRVTALPDLDKVNGDGRCSTII